MPLHPRAGDKNKAERIRDYIKDGVQSRRYTHRIPPLNTLAAHFEVNIKTVKRAVEELEKTGLLYSRRGKGTFVRGGEPDDSAAPILFVGRGGREISQILATELTTAVNTLDLGYPPFSLLIPPERVAEGRRLKLPAFGAIAGLLVEGGLLTHFRDVPQAPIVLVHNTGGDESLPAVIADHADGIRQAVDYLHSLGHRSMAYLGVEDFAGFSGGGAGAGEDMEKRRTFERRTGELGVRADPKWNIPTYYRVEAGHQAGLRLLAADDRPTAAVCVNDEVALGVLNACDELGLRVPGDFSVVGFDDRSPALMRRPQLTTVRVDFRAMMLEAVGRLDRLARGEDASRMPPARIPTQLVVRASTGVHHAGHAGHALSSDRR